MTRDNARQDVDEALVDRGLRGLGARRAPAGLEARVFDELARRAALPWWRRSFAHWPPTPRAALLLACAGLAPLAWRAGACAAAFLNDGVRRAAVPLALVRDILRTAIDAQSSLRLFDGIVPPTWMAGILVITGILYVALIALTAIAYRTLYLNT